MSGHSKWSTIKHKKAANDQARGKVFSKLSKAISIAIKTGGGANPETNYKLRMAIDTARAADMPKANIDRIINKAEKEDENLEEVKYEGFGPEGINVIVEVVTDNRNRTAQEIKGLFERGGGRLGGPGSVSFNFEPRGLILIKKSAEKENQILQLIDLGVEEFEETEVGIEVYVSPSKLSSLRQEIEKVGFEIISVELIQKPKSLQSISDPQKGEKVVRFLDNLDNQDDVQQVFTNADLLTE